MNKTAHKSILISCSGLGMGNAARVAALIEALDEQVACHVVTWGSGFSFLDQYHKKNGGGFTLHRLEDYAIKPNFFKYLRSFLRNSFFLKRLIARVRPDLIVLDSDYHFPAYLNAKAPVVYVGQTFDILERARASRYRPASWKERLSFLLRERVDGWYQKAVSNLILVPCFGGFGTVGGKIRRIPLIVRREYLASPKASHTEGLGILLSGSQIEREFFTNLANKEDLRILSSTPSRSTNLDECSTVVTQGGLSSISECIARNRFMIVIPIRDHAEQFLNAQQVEKLGLGICASPYDFKSLSHLLDRVERVRQLSPHSQVDCTGATVTAQILLHGILKMERQAPRGKRLHAVQSFYLQTRLPNADAGHPRTGELKLASQGRDQGIVREQ